MPVAIIWMMCAGARIAIDGPVASGKTAVGRLLAWRLGFKFLDTGLMYRAVTLSALDLRLPLDDQISLAQLGETLSIDVVSKDGDHRILLGDKDVTDALRATEVENAVSIVAQVQGVRTALVEKQRTLAKDGDIVVVGRDIGTVVLPDATLKLFLEASVQERARRRHLELVSHGNDIKYQNVEKEILRRDQLDTQRMISPLRPAADAWRMDTEKVTVKGIVSKILVELKECLGNG